MKKIVLFACLPMLAFAQTKKQFSINGNIAGLKDSTLVFVSDLVTGAAIAQDYAFNGKFSLKGTLDEPTYTKLGFTGIKDEYDLFLFNDVVTVSGKSSAITKLVAAGSATHKDFTTYNNTFNPLKDKLNALVTKINGTQQGKQRDSLIQQFELTKNKVITEVTNFTTLKPASPVSSYVLYVVNPVFKGGVEELEQRYNQLKPTAKVGEFARMIEKLVADYNAKNNADAATKVGAIAPDFTQNDVDGKPVALSSFRGKYVLVDFWASWCGPCRRENPNVVDAYNRFKNKNFTILGVSLDRPDGKAAWLNAIKEDNLTWTHVSDLQFWNNAAAKLYNVSGIPFNLLLDPNGKIVAKNLRGTELISTLEGILK